MSNSYGSMPPPGMPGGINQGRNNIVQAMMDVNSPPPAPFGQQPPGMGTQPMGQPPIGPTPGSPTGGLPGASPGMGGGVPTMPGMGVGNIRPPMGMGGQMPGIPPVMGQGPGPQPPSMQPLASGQGY